MSPSGGKKNGATMNEANVKSVAEAAAAAEAAKKQKNDGGGGRDNSSSQAKPAVLSSEESSDDGNVRTKTGNSNGKSESGAAVPYRDYSREVPDATDKKNGGAENFPMKLHEILSNPEFQDVIAWLPREFRV